MWVPAVKVADDADLLGVGRPHSEMNAALAGYFAEVRAHLLIGSVVRTLPQQIQIVIAEPLIWHGSGAGFDACHDQGAWREHVRIAKQNGRGLAPAARFLGVQHYLPVLLRAASRQHKGDRFVMCIEQN